jgi:hypothetical protein
VLHGKRAVRNRAVLVAIAKTFKGLSGLATAANAMQGPAIPKTQGRGFVDIKTHDFFLTSAVPARRNSFNSSTSGSE